MTECLISGKTILEVPEVAEFRQIVPNGTDLTAWSGFVGTIRSSLPYTFSVRINTTVRQGEKGLIIFEQPKHGLFAIYLETDGQAITSAKQRFESWELAGQELLFRIAMGLRREAERLTDLAEKFANPE